MQRVFRKTDKGRDEVATRAHRLGPRERSVLILVDGKLSAGQLAEQLKHLPNAAGILDQLAEGGFVELADGVAAEAGGKLQPLDEDGQAAIRFARRFMLDVLGPDVDSLVEQLEKCRFRQEALPVLDKCREVLSLGAGRRKSDEFWAGLGGLVSGH